MIISGGQTGADQGALEGAYLLGIPTGGWMPREFLTEVGPRPDFAKIYGLREHRSLRYPPRTEANVRDADATVWIGPTIEPGFSCTRRACRKLERPFGIIDGTSAIAGSLALRQFVDQHHVRTLNVAGPRQSRYRFARQLAADTIIVAFRNGGRP